MMIKAKICLYNNVIFLATIVACVEIVMACPFVFSHS